MVGNATEIRCTFSQRRIFFKINRRIYESFLFFFLQATVLGVLAENSLPMTMAPVMINTAKALAKDKAALDRLSMDRRTTASYKITYGLGGSFLGKTVTAMRTCPFSLNIDESTSKDLKRVLAVLVSYYSCEEDAV